MAKKKVPDVVTANSKGEDASALGIAEQYDRLVKLRLYDPQHPFQALRFRYLPFYHHRYTKADIIRYLSDPKRFEKELRHAVRFIYHASPHFHRLIQYFAGLSDLAYVVSPYKINPKTVNPQRVETQYRKVLNALSAMKIVSQFRKILLICLREDVFYGIFRAGDDDILVQQLPSDYCRICSVEGGVPNVTFDFRYFDRFPDNLDNYPPEFRTKYEMYRNGLNARVDHPYWIELDAPDAFAIKCNNDLLDCAIPPFAGVLPEVFDIESYKELKMEGTELENYAMLAMRIPMTEEGEWGIDLRKAKEFWENLDSVLPDRVGSVLTPMQIDKFSFERSDSSDPDTVTESEQNLFTAAGVSSLLFNNDKASANALLLSIKADQCVTYGVVKSIEDVINRYIQSKSYGRYFKVTFLDCSPFNRKELGDAYLKAASYGLPTISMYAASQGLAQAEIDTMSFLEGDVLGLQDMFRPIQSSSQMSSEDINGGQAGAPQKDAGELTDSGEQSREDSDDWG